MAVQNFGKEMHLQPTGGGSTLTKLSELLSLKAPSQTVGVIDVTTHDSAEGIMESMPEGVSDPGDGSATIHWIPGSATDTLVQAVLAARQVRNVKFVLNGATAKYALTGPIIVTSYEPDDSPVQGKQTATIGFKAAGKMTLAAVAP